MTRHEIICEISRIDWTLEVKHLTYAEKKTALNKRAQLINSLAQFHTQKEGAEYIKELGGN